MRRLLLLYRFQFADGHATSNNGIDRDCRHAFSVLISNWPQRLTTARQSGAVPRLLDKTGGVADEIAAFVQQLSDCLPDPELATKQPPNEARPTGLGA